MDACVLHLENDLKAHRLHTVCQEALCPNRGECFSKRLATFLIMGNVCTRDCRFCAVRTGNPPPLDPDEPKRVAEEVKGLGLSFTVITSVTRDDLPDGGAHHFVRVIEAIRKKCPGIGLEVLIPDFKGSEPALDQVMDAAPQVFNHNVETVPRLYSAVRPQADYGRSLKVLGRAKERRPSLLTKSGLMLGFGEERREVMAVMKDLTHHGCDILTLGQYLSPSKAHHPVVEFIPPSTFEEYRQVAMAMGFRSVASGPFVRSSYMAETYYRQAMSF